MNLRVTDTHDGIYTLSRRLYSDVDSVLDRARQLVPYSKREISSFQAPILAVLANLWQSEGTSYLEVGTALGYSAALLALSAPQSSVVTLNSKLWQWEQSQKNLSQLSNVEVRLQDSMNYLDDPSRPSKFTFVFIDGDHSPGGIAGDLRWWDAIESGGLLLLHDVSCDGSDRPCPSVYEAAVQFGRNVVGRDADIWVSDLSGVAMAGWVK